MSKRAYKFRFYPTSEQKLLLEKTFGCVRFVYNHILDYRSKAYAEDKVRIGFKEANAALTLLKKDPEKAWLSEVSCVPLQQVLRHQQKAFTNFFEKRAGYPSFKKKQHRQSAEFTRSAFKYVGGQLFLAKRKVARLHAKISDTRQDNLHQVSRRLINENQVICVESLKVKNMVKNRKLAKSIADAGWGELVRQLDYKGDWAGRQLVKIDQWYPSSKTCSSCGHVLEKLALSTRSWTCPVCGEVHDRDTNAAKNIRAVGLTVLACGERVRPMAQVA